MSGSKRMHIFSARWASRNRFRFAGLYTVRHWSSTNGFSDPRCWCTLSESSAVEILFRLCVECLLSADPMHTLTRIDLCHNVKVLEVRTMPYSCQHVYTRCASYLSHAICLNESCTIYRLHPLEVSSICEHE